MKTVTNFLSNRFCWVVFLAFAIFGKASAQIDPHFSQYYAYPLWLNPALTGAFDGDYRASVNLKQQWGSISNSFLTGGASFDKGVGKNLSLGATVLNQKAGELSFNYLNALVSGAYRVRFGTQGLNIVSFGLQAGVVHRSFDASNARFGDQFNGANGYDPGVVTSDVLMNSSSTAPDINAGVMYFDANPDQFANPFFGVSVAHINRPRERYLSTNQRMPMRFTAHGGSRIQVSPSVDLMPNAMYMYQGNAQEFLVGGYAQFVFGPETNFLAGVNYRFDDAAIGYLGVQYKNLMFGLSYDINVSSLSTAVRSGGGLELSISLIGHKGIFGPNFFCPRL